MRTKHYSSKSCVPVIVCINYCLNASLSQWNLGHLITFVSYRFANMCVINVLLLYAVSLIMFENVHAELAIALFLFYIFFYVRLTHGNERLLTYLLTNQRLNSTRSSSSCFARRSIGRCVIALDPFSTGRGFDSHYCTVQNSVPRMQLTHKRVFVTMCPVQRDNSVTWMVNRHTIRGAF